jgi:membrane dipeptidase
MDTTRRKILKSALVTGAVAIVAPMINRGYFKVFANSTQQYSKRAINLVNDSLVIDMLNQFKYNSLMTPRKQRLQWLSKPESFTQVDVQKYFDSGINVFALGSSPDSYESGLRFFADWNGFIAGYSHWLTRIDSRNKLATIHASRKVGILISTQNSLHFRNVDDIGTFFGLGQRLSQLTYNSKNQIGCGFVELDDTGLTQFGSTIVEKMNQVGMAVDVSHCGDKTTLDALDLSQKPVVITHAACRAIAPGLYRCKTDEMIRKMAVKGGVMGIATIRFLVREQEPVTIEHYLNHFEHIAKLVGIEHVGIGSDFDLDTEDAYPTERDAGTNSRDASVLARYQTHVGEGGIIGIKGLNHPKRVYDITEGLIRRKYSDANIKLILGGNFSRALSSNWLI